MSYKTNPIINRIKINKGWKNPYLPTKTLNYSRDISLWFKVYLLLKVFLNLKKIQLVSYEIRFDQQNKKILYLRINKKGIRGKKRKKKNTALNKILKIFQTPLLKNKNANSIFFLYKDLIHLKNLSFWTKNRNHKKILTKFWLTKPKISTWINTLEKIMFVRQNTKKGFQYAKKNKNFIPIPQIKFKFYTNKQKQIQIQVSRIKKKIFNLNIRFVALIQQKKTKNLQKLIQNLQQAIFKNQIKIKKINQLYKFLIYFLKNFYIKKKKKTQLKKNLFINRIQRKNLNLSWKILKKKMNSLTRFFFLKQELPTLLLQFNKILFKNTQKNNVTFLKNRKLLQNTLHLNFLINHIFFFNHSVLIKNHFLLKHLNNQSKVFSNPMDRQKINKKLFLKNLQVNTFLKANLFKNKKNIILKRKFTFNLFYDIALLILLRRKKKKSFQSLFFRKKFKIFRKNVRLNLKLKTHKQYTKFLAKKKFFALQNKREILIYIRRINKNLKNDRIAKYYKYRLPYQKVYFNFKQLNTQLKLKYLIQDFVQKYFFVQVEVKIEHVLNVQKNTNFFRLVFPVRKKNQKQLVKKGRLNTWNQKQIFLMSRLNLSTPVKKKFKNKLKKKKLKLIDWKLELKKKNAIKILNKKEFFILAEKKKVKWRMKNSFSRFKRAKDFKQNFKYLIPTLMNFSRSFEPQILANILAKVLLKVKKQTKMLNTIRFILQAIQLPKNIGYKIVLTGRINSKKKSRLIYITTKQITLQSFDKNMNYAYSQANARIGAFGIKIWVYSKK